MSESARAGAWARILGVSSAGVVLLIVAWVAYGRLSPPEVDTVGARPAEVVRTLVVAGRVRPPAQAQLGMSAGGVVREVRVREGDAVAAGDVLVLLDDREAAALVAQAEARFVDAGATAQDAMLRAELEVEQARRDAARLQSVFAEGGITLQRVEQARQRAADAESRMTALGAGSEEGGVTARVAEAQAALDAARARRAAHVLTAPFDGTVLTRLVEPGDAVTVGRGVLEVAATGPTELVAFPAEENLGRLSQGAPARASADAFPDQAFDAAVSLVAPSIDADQGTVEVRLAIDGPVPYLRPGMTVSVNLEVERRHANATVPVSAVRGLATADPWVVVIADGRAQRRPVDLGAVGDNLVEVVSGLDDGEQVIRMADQVEPGDRVRVGDES